MIRLPGNDSAKLSKSVQLRASLRPTMRTPSRTARIQLSAICHQVALVFRSVPTVIAKKVSGGKHGDDRFFSRRVYHRHLDTAFLYVHHCVRGITLRVNRFAYFPCHPGRIKKILHIERAIFSGFDFLQTHIVVAAAVCHEAKVDTFGYAILAGCPKVCTNENPP
jgi:hypothetical protein